MNTQTTKSGRDRIFQTVHELLNKTVLVVDENKIGDMKPEALYSTAKRKTLTVRGKPIATLVGIKGNDGEVRVSFSRYNRHDRRFKKEVGRTVALSRINNTPFTIPYSDKTYDPKHPINSDHGGRIDAEINRFVLRCKKYFKTEDVIVIR